MRESKYTNIRKQTQQDRMIRIKQKIQQRKQKLILKGYVIEQSQSSTLQNTNNSQVQKVHKQKLKNRQAAQKSRQQKKKYVKQLQEQNKYLKFQLSLLKYCTQCRSQLNIEIIPQQQFTSTSQDNQNQSTHYQHLNEQDDHLQDQSSSFIRISTTHDQSSSIGMYLFVCMIVLGIVCMGSRTGQVDNGFEPMKRDLQVSYTRENIQRAQELSLSSSSNYNKFNQHVYYMNMKSTYSTSQLPISFPTHNYSNAIIPLFSIQNPQNHSDNLQCFQQLINQFQTKKLFQSQYNLRSLQQYKNQQKSLLLCSIPLIYKGKSQKNQNIVTNFIDIFVKGTEVINIFTGENHSNNLNHVQLNGLYKISASVQSIEQIDENYRFIY